jgi:hypothetical protein
MLPGSCSPAAAVPRCSGRCSGLRSGLGPGVCGGVCPKQHDVQPRVTKAKTISAGWNWRAMNNVTLSSLQLPIHITKVSMTALLRPKPQRRLQPAPSPPITAWPPVASRIPLRTLMLDRTRRLYQLRITGEIAISAPMALPELAEAADVRSGFPRPVRPLKRV